MLVFEKSRPGRGISALPECDVDIYTLPDEDMRETDLHLPEMAEVDLSRHYAEAASLNSLRCLKPKSADITASWHIVHMA